jgi:pilus assembly protein CpaB
MVPGEPFLEARLAPKGGGDGLSAVIPPDRRAMTVKVNEASGVAGFIHPGDNVDVIATMAPREGTSEVRSRIVLQQIKVIAVGEELSAQNAKPIKVPVVTLLVTPEESERLALASSHGELQLTMRGNTATDTVETPGISPLELFGVKHDEPRPAAPVQVAAASPSRGRGQRAPAAPVVEAPASKPHEDVVEIIRGNRSEERRLRSSEGR